MTFEEIGMTKTLSSYRKRELVLRREREVLIKDETERLVEAMKEEAPKKTGVFAEGLGYSSTTTFTEDVMTSIFVRGEHAFLLPFIVNGTKPHEIPKGGSAAQLAKGYPLGFYWANGPKGSGLYHYWSVQHKGTKPNDFPGRALKKWRPGAAQRLREAGVAIARLDKWKV